MPPLRFHCVAEMEPWTVATLELTVSNHSARSHSLDGYYSICSDGDWRSLLFEMNV
jgi:hypothetical protein